jgi:ABC-type transport system involved in cytochrome c biogenesis permease subunit
MPIARVRLTVDGTAKEFELPAMSEETPKSELSAVDGHHRRVSVELRQDEIDLGFQIFLHRFQRKLDPGGGMASHYSSEVDFLDRGDVKKVQILRKDVLITLNAPVDFLDPRSGATYRLFQSGFEPPYLPGDPKFDALVGTDRTRDRVYLSRLSVNSDPGRPLKYVGCILIILGILVVYYVRSKRSLDEIRAATLAIASILVISFPSVCHAAADDDLEWNTWAHLPVLGEGRVVPMDTFARETVEAICGNDTPTLMLPDGSVRTFNAAELVFEWLADPKSWQKSPFLIARDESLRKDILGLPLYDEAGRRLGYASPEDVEKSDELGRRWSEVEERASAEGIAFRLSGFDKKMKLLVDAYAKFHLLTFDPQASKEPPQRFFARLRSSADAWRKLAMALQNADRIYQDDAIRKPMVQAGETLGKLVALAHEKTFSLAETAEPVAVLSEAGDMLAKQLTNAADKPLAALASNFYRQTIEMQLAIYDQGESLRWMPALSPGAVETDRSPDDDSAPWLSFQATIFGSDRAMHAYPQAELKSVRKAWSDVVAAYRDRGAADRSAKFSVAMHRLSDALAAMGRAVQPLRAKMAIQQPDEDALAATAYPRQGATDLEVFYNRLNPFFWAWVVSLAATICLLFAVGRWRHPLFWLGIVIAVAAFALATLGMTLRGVIMGLVPLTGMFETVVFVALYAALLGLWYTLKPLAKSRSDGGSQIREVLARRYFVLAGATVSFVGMVLAYYAPASVMHRHIGSVAPILRDNFWLAVHVVTIMASYASAAIALILGNIALGYYLFGRYVDHRPPDECSRLTGFIYTVVRITVLLLAAGTILGALWADKAWGRFWAWDPKEVWALISLLVYLLILHARHIGWSGDFGMALTAVFGATAVLFTWYGVNFLLGSGMHAYGSGVGGQWAVGSAVFAQWLFLAIAAGRYWIETGEERQTTAGGSQP